MKVNVCYNLINLYYEYYNALISKFFSFEPILINNLLWIWIMLKVLQYEILKLSNMYSLCSHNFYTRQPKSEVAIWHYASHISWEVAKWHSTSHISWEVAIWHNASHISWEVSIWHYASHISWEGAIWHSASYISWHQNNIVLRRRTNKITWYKVASEPYTLLIFSTFHETTTKTKEASIMYRYLEIIS